MLKKMSFVFCAGLFAVAIAGGCKKEEKGGAAAGGDCAALGAKSTKDGLANIPKDVPADAKKTFEDLSKKGGDLVARLCKEDKWSAEAIKCGLTAKDAEKECADKLTPDQNKHIQEEFTKMMGEGIAMPGGDDDKDEPLGEAADKGVAAADGEGDKADGEGDDDKAAAGGAANTGLAECDAYIAMVEKYVACDKIPQESRDATKQSIESMKAAWGDMGAMPAESRKQTGDACKQGADALKQGAEAMGCKF